MEGLFKVRPESYYEGLRHRIVSITTSLTSRELDRHLIHFTIQMGAGERHGVPLRALKAEDVSLLLDEARSYHARSDHTMLKYRLIEFLVERGAEKTLLSLPSSENPSAGPSEPMPQPA